jgi:hypothetical protein
LNVFAKVTPGFIEGIIDLATANTALQTIYPGVFQAA